MFCLSDLIPDVQYKKLCLLFLMHSGVISTEKVHLLVRVSIKKHRLLFKAGTVFFCFIYIGFKP